MPAVGNCFKYIFRLLLSRHFVSALLPPFFHNQPIQPEFVVKPELCVPCFHQLCCRQQLSEIVRIRLLNHAFVGEVVSLS